MENVSIEYLAGLFDGEGTVTLGRKHALGHRTPVLSISSTTHKLLELCVNKWGGHISIHKIYKSHHKQSWSWKLAGDKAIFAMSELMPHIHEPLKRARMKHVVDNYKSVTPRNGRYTPEQLLAKQQFETNFFHLSDTVEINL